MIRLLLAVVATLGSGLGQGDSPLSRVTTGDSPLSRTVSRFSPAVEAQEAAALAGKWALNPELSQLSREVGFSADWMTTGGAGGGAPGGGGGGGGRGGAPGGQSGGGSNRSGFPVLRVSREDSMRNTLLTAEVREPAARVTIAETANEITITPDKGSPRTFHPNGREEVVQLDGVTVATTSALEAGRLVVRYKVDQQHELRYTYSRVASPPQLVVEVQFVQRGGGDTVKRVYEPASETDTAPVASAPATSQTTPPASGQPASQAPTDRGAPQNFDRQPEAQFKGLTALGVVVEGLGSQATKCGLRQEAIESAMMKQLSGAGFKVSVNQDEDTYLYVNVMTATMGDGNCLSRYDAYVYSHTTAGLSYHPTPVLVEVC